MRDKLVSQHREESKKEEDELRKDETSSEYVVDVYRRESAPSTVDLETAELVRIETWNEDMLVNEYDSHSDYDSEDSNGNHNCQD